MPKRTSEEIIDSNREVMAANVALDRFDFSEPVFQPEPGTDQTEREAHRRGVENLLTVLTGQRRDGRSSPPSRGESAAMNQYITTRLDETDYPALIQELELIEWAMDRTDY